MNADEIHLARSPRGVSAPYPAGEYPRAGEFRHPKPAKLPAVTRRRSSYGIVVAVSIDDRNGRKKPLTSDEFGEEFPTEKGNLVMAEHDELIRVLNEAVSLEYTAAVQYNQHSMLLTGRDKALFEDLFQDSAREALSHAKMWGDRIVYLGGAPKAELGTIHQSTNITEMLEMDLEVEKKAVEIYSRAHEVCKHVPTRYMLENHILDEDKDVENLQKLLGKVSIAQATASVVKDVSFRRH